MKIYILFKNVETNIHIEKVIDVINKCIQHDEFISFNNERKMFTYVHYAKSIEDLMILIT